MARVDGASQPVGWPERLLLLGAFLGIALLIYDPALRGPFLSDDNRYVHQNPYVTDAGADELLEVLDPSSQATHLTMGYTPLSTLATVGEWRAFGPAVFGYHVVNVVLHAFVAWGLVWTFRRSGLPPVGAAAAGVFFLVHPANVEAVAWISQLKSLLSLGLALCAIGVHRRRPGLGALVFAAALLAKPAAVFALPVIVVQDLLRGERRWKAWLAWTACLLAYAGVAQLSFLAEVPAEAPLHPHPLVLGRTIAAIALRYVVMGGTGLGVAAFHEPMLAVSWWDPWWLAALLGFAALTVRAILAARAKREEAAYWVWFAAAFVPVSQLVPFIHPMGDRYLYFMLPGLLGAVGLALCDGLARLEVGVRRTAGVAALVAVAALCVWLGTQSQGRARLWISQEALMQDSARAYPAGLYANLLRLNEAARRGDADTAVAALGAARERGFGAVLELVMDPKLARVRNDPRFQRHVEEIALDWIERTRDLQHPTQLDLRGMAIAHYARGELPEARATLERALEMGGPFDAVVRADLQHVLRGSP